MGADMTFPSTWAVLPGTPAAFRGCDISAQNLEAPADDGP